MLCMFDKHSAFGCQDTHKHCNDTPGALQGCFPEPNLDSVIQSIRLHCAQIFALHRSEGLLS